VSRGIVVQEQDPLCERPAAFFFQNVLQLHRVVWPFAR
jgi:preprotein translocase subunit SecE